MWLTILVRQKTKGLTRLVRPKTNDLAEAKFRLKLRLWFLIIKQGGILSDLYFRRPIENKMVYKDFTAMPVWQKALALLVRVYEITKRFPAEERFGMTADMRRSANSVLHNIAEGFGRYEKKDKTRFYKISRGSAYEINSQAYASHILKYISINERDELVDGYKSIIIQEDSMIKTIEQLLPIIKPKPQP